MSSRATEPEEGGLGPLDTPDLSDLGQRIAAKRDAALEQAEAEDEPTTEPDIEADTEPDTESGELDDEPVVEPDSEDAEPDTSADEDEPEEGDEPEAEDADEFVLGRYKTIEDAETGIREKDATIIRLYRELDEAKNKQPEQPTTTDVPATADKPQLDVEAWNEWAAEQVEAGAGVQGAMAALERGGAEGYDIYIGRWIESDDPSERAEAIRFNNEVQRQVATQQAIAAVKPVVDDASKPPQGESDQAAYDAVARRHPDFGEMGAEMDRVAKSLDDDTRSWLRELATGDRAGQERAWEYLYRTAVATKVTPRRAATTRTERERRRVSGDAAKIAATVSSSEATATRTPLSEAEQAVLRRRNGIRERAGIPLLTEE